MSRLLEILPPWRWLAALFPATIAFFYAPIAFGGLTPDTVTALDRLLAHSFLLWLCVLVLERRLPRLPVLLAGALGVLSLMGVSQFFNPEWSVFEDEPFESHCPWLPGSVESEETVFVFLNLLVMMLAGLFVRDGISNGRVRWFLFRTVALSGLVVAVIGIYQKAAHLDGMLWSDPTPFERNFFAAFRYHGNAASFLNLSWPAALAVWIRSRLMRPGSIIASLDLCVFLIIFGAVFVNSSKAGPFLAFLGLLLAGWSFRHELFIATTSRASLVVMIGFLILAGGIVVLPGVAFTLSKWGELFTNGGSMHGRIEAYQACLLAIPASGLFGHGAGSFMYVFPPFAQDFGIDIFWEHAHQDWLQAILEWGWIGFAAWGVVFGGALFRLRNRMRDAWRLRRPELTTSAAWIALVVVLIHSLFDFPMQIPALQWLVVFYLGVAWSDDRSPREETSAKP
jgi:O-antigen ligase